jgi:hypothetical protein
MKMKRLVETLGMIGLAASSMNCLSEDAPEMPPAPPTVPATCAQARSFYGVSADGPQTLYVKADRSMPWQAYCSDMFSESPREFLDLVDVGPDGSAANYSQFREFPREDGKSPQRDVRVTTRYDKVRIDPTTFAIDITDITFAHSDPSVRSESDPDSDSGDRLAISEAFGGTVVDHVPFGVAMECGTNWRDEKVLDAVKVEPIDSRTRARVDLSGLPFRIVDTQYCSSALGLAMPDAANPESIVKLVATGASSRGKICGRASLRCLPDPTINGEVAGNTTVQLAYVKAPVGH